MKNIIENVPNHLASIKPGDQIPKLRVLGRWREKINKQTEVNMIRRTQVPHVINLTKLPNKLFLCPIS